MCRCQQIRDDRLVDQGRKGQLFKAAFQREGVGLQPDFQGHIERLSQLRVLRRMDVEIDQTGDHAGLWR